MKKLYLLLAIIGFILPLSQFISWLLEFGVDAAIVDPYRGDVMCRGLFRASAVFALTREAFKKQTLSVMFVT